MQRKIALTILLAAFAGAAFAQTRAMLAAVACHIWTGQN